ncbi:metallophosphoesterase [Verrucomicrobiota bacterium]
MNAIVISDLHIGSKYSLCGEFIDFAGKIPSEYAIVLNGDVVNYNHRCMTRQHMEALDLLRKESLRRPVVWIRGNHDRNYMPEDPEKIEFKSCFNINGKLFVSHGHSYEDRGLLSQTFVMIFYFFYNMRIRMGAPSMHVAFYAKRFPRLYRAFRRRVMENAVEHAGENNVKAVACGHTHYAEECMFNDIRYINTGSWTEKPIHYLSVNESEMELRVV